MLRLTLLMACVCGCSCGTKPRPPPPQLEWKGFQPAALSLPAGGRQAKGLQAGDASGNGTVDLVLVSSAAERVFLFEGVGDGTFAAPRPFEAGSTPQDVAIRDINRDGVPDLLIVGHFSNALMIRLGSGQGEFREGVSYGVGTHSQRVRMADLDGDGNLDAVTKNAGSGGFFDITVLKGRGDGAFEPAIPYAIDGLPRDLLVADVNEDAVPDVLVLNTNTNSVDVLAGRGDGTLGPSHPFRLGGALDDEPFRFECLDVNGDGHADLLVTHGAATPGYLSVHLGKGDGTFTTAAHLPLEAPVELATADFNQDGQVDLAVSSLEGSLVYLLGQGGGTFAEPVLVSSGKQVSSLVAADLDGDGFTDLAWTTDDSVEVRLSQTAPSAP